MRVIFPSPVSSPLTNHLVLQITKLLTTGEYPTISGKTLKYMAETVSICVHGDLPGAVALAASVRKAINSLKQ